MSKCSTYGPFFQSLRVSAYEGVNCTCSLKLLFSENKKVNGALTEKKNILQQLTILQ